MFSTLTARYFNLFTKKISHKIVHLFIIFALAHSSSLAQNPDTKSAIQVKADEVAIDNKKNQVQFLGNVRIEFSDFVINTQEILFFYTKKRKKSELSSILIPRKLQLNQGDNILLASKAEYNAKTKKLTLKENVQGEYNNYIIQTKIFSIYIENMD